MSSQMKFQSNPPIESRCLLYIKAINMNARKNQFAKSDPFDDNTLNTPSISAHHEVYDG